MIIQFDQLTGYARSEVVPLTKSAVLTSTESTSTDDPFAKFDFTPVPRPKTFISVNENV